MNLQKINWKIYFSKLDNTMTTECWFKLFNQWIPQSPEIFVDVADYSHVSDGPKVILVGHYVDCAFDHTDRRFGFWYACKKDQEGDNIKKIRSTFCEFLKKTQSLLSDPWLKGKVDVATNEFLFLINDRALCPNTPQSFESVRPILEEALKPVLGTFDCELVKNPKQRFQITLKVSQPKGFQELLTAISSF